MGPSAQDEIVAIEDEVERLAATAESARNGMRMGRGAMVLGALSLAGAWSGLLPRPEAFFLLAIALLLGGVVAWGSSRSTLGQTEVAMAELEARRIALIDALPLS